MAIFVGEHSAKIDDKGRIVLPVAFKKVDGEASLDFVILEKSRQGKCIDIYPEQSWIEIVNEFKRKLNPLNPKHDRLLEAYFKGFVRVGVAPNGRINIPTDFLVFADLKKTAMFIGMFSKIRLKSAGEVASEVMSDEEFLAELEKLTGGENQ